MYPLLVNLRGTFRTHLIFSSEGLWYKIPFKIQKIIILFKFTFSNYIIIISTSSELEHLLVLML